MSNQASTTEIANYLTEVKKLLSAGKYDFVPRRKNMQALAQHGLTIADAKNEILGIVQENGEDILKCLAFHEDDFA